MLIFDIKRFSLHDGPGIRTTVFLKGCPLRCAWCHNPESQSRRPQIMLRPARCMQCGACIAACPEQAVTWQGERVVTDRALCTACGTCTPSCAGEARELIGREVPAAELLAEVERDRPFFDESGGGVTFSGGEPLVQARALQPLLRACQEAGLHTAVDTCGAVSWAALDSVRPYTDLFLYDLKLMDGARHRQATGAGNRLILDNLRRLAAAGAAIELRLALIPGVNDDEDNLRATADFAASLPALREVRLLPYHDTARDKYGRLGLPYRMAGTAPPGEAKLAAAGEILRGYGLAVLD